MVVESATCNELSGESERSHREVERGEREVRERERDRENSVDVSLATSTCLETGLGFVCCHQILIKLVLLIYQSSFFSLIKITEVILIY